MFKRFMTAGLYFNKDDGAGGGKTTEDDAEDEDKGKEKSADGSSQKSEDEKKEEKEGKGKEEKKFSQADVDQILKVRLARETKKAEEEAETARKKAEEEALAKNSEFQKLAEKRQQTITELEGQIKDLSVFKDQSEKYKGALDKYLAEAKKILPKHVLPLVEKLDVVDALEYITANADELGVKIAGVPETPKEKEKKLTDEQKKQATASMQSLIQQNY